MTKPVLSVIIPAFNVQKYLRPCLSSILACDYQDLEIIVVDNGSTDGTRDFLKKLARKTPKVRPVFLSKNFGPAKARNEGVKKALGKYLSFLDSDTVVDKNWAGAALNHFSRYPKEACLQSKLLLYNTKNFDYAGEYLGLFGFLTPLAVYAEKDRGQYDSPVPVLAAKSAGMFVGRAFFEEIGGFDEDYFMFLEDTDLGWRLWLGGFSVSFCPASIVFHRFSSTKKVTDKTFYRRLVRFHGTKNYIMTLVKNLSLPYLARILPVHICLWLGLAGYFALKGDFASAANIIKGIFWNIINIGKILRKRKRIQEKRKLTDEELFVKNRLMKQKSLFYFIGRFLKSKKE